MAETRAISYPHYGSSDKSGGKVYLVGAGLGGVEYLTLQAQQLLTTAEVLIYDALVNEDLLAIAPSNCLPICVGKRGGQPSTPQVKINQLLVDYCHQGKLVLRLKSGDPFIFGRVSTEIQALRAAGCNFQVIPGLSSALAAPLLAGIPLTDPVLSRGFMVVTAHEPEALAWDILAGVETLVILMGGKQLPEILQQLQHHDRSPSTPIAIIQWAGSPQQQVWTGDLSNIQAQLPPHFSPAVIVVGEVVRLRDYLLPNFPNFLSLTAPMTGSTPAALPLTGKTILITRAAHQASEFAAMLQAEGAMVLEMPTLEIVPPSSWQELDRSITCLESFHWLILTSANAVTYFMQRLFASGRDLRSLAPLKIAVVGSKTAVSLREFGINPDFIPPEFVADSLVAHFPENLLGLKVLFPRVETGGREVLVQEMHRAGAIVTEVAAYQSRCPDQMPEAVLQALQREQIDVITFTSSKGVQHFWQILQQSGVTGNMGDKKPELLLSTPSFTLDFSVDKYLQRLVIAAIGPQTAKSCRTVLGRVDLEAQEYTLEGLTQSLVAWGISLSC